MSKFGPHTIVVLTKMCKIMNIHYTEKLFTSEQWYIKHSLTKKQEQIFQKWLKTYLLKNPAARKEIMYAPINNKKYVGKVVNWFLFNYGWKIN